MDEGYEEEIRDNIKLLRENIEKLYKKPTIKRSSYWGDDKSQEEEKPDLSAVDKEALFTSLNRVESNTKHFIKEYWEIEDELNQSKKEIEMFKELFSAFKFSLKNLKGEVKVVKTKKEEKEDEEYDDEGEETDEFDE